MRDFIPTNCHIMAKIILDIKNIAIWWQIYWGNNKKNFIELG